MKKFLIGLIAAGVLAGCGQEDVSNEETKETVQKNVEKKDEPTQEELDAKLKEEAKKADVVSLNEDHSAGQKVTATGKVSFIYEEGISGSFTLETEEDGGYGMYNIKNFALAELSEGQEVTIYGTTTGNIANDGSVEINATIIE